uniref:Uncharacterized protein n=1 Tax=Caenorhabditis japonica TaxID=281687 RepID=A0A8R1IA39_CAEJA
MRILFSQYCSCGCLQRSNRTYATHGASMELHMSIDIERVTASTHGSITKFGMFWSSHRSTGSDHRLLRGNAAL